MARFLEAAMKLWDLLAESKIREWTKRREEKRTAGELELDESDEAPLLEDAKSIESQLFDEARAARHQARQCEDPEERDALLERSKKAQLRMMVLLERGGYPLLARSMENRLNTDDDD
ncbi:hypothetical protein FIV42_12015 [Persicimonas caeni]|uniref:Uncharacterized protein n=1 Tax=Persicimonas caeni TaxID=2292766 RepID=A0A4Y6PSZ5_PERCE|nr:hypothetical protein [Persicimonas caeni]QDG51442.1 hypothetical protein FIV42_12015 [Persicimonas caeni]QED32663.1 hypothetical protein FRD00_12010 [Persicimonas caeni]